MTQIYEVTQGAILDHRLQQIDLPLIEKIKDPTAFAENELGAGALDKNGVIPAADGRSAAVSGAERAGSG